MWNTLRCCTSSLQYNREVTMTNISEILTSNPVQGRASFLRPITVILIVHRASKNHMSAGFERFCGPPGWLDDSWWAVGIGSYLVACWWAPLLSQWPPWPSGAPPGRTRTARPPPPPWNQRTRLRTSAGWSPGAPWRATRCWRRSAAEPFFFSTKMSFVSWARASTRKRDVPVFKVKRHWRADLPADWVPAKMVTNCGSNQNKRNDDFCCSSLV